MAHLGSQGKKLRWNIDPKSLISPTYKTHCSEDFTRAEAQMKARTSRYELYGLVAKNKSIHDVGRRGPNRHFSEGSTQYILRKSLANTIQRVPDGELETQYDKATPEHIITEYIFHNKVLWSEIEGIDLLSQLTNTFKMSWIYAFAPVRTGFEKDHDGDVRISYNLEHWADVFINADCKDIRRPQVVYHREYMSKAEVMALLDAEGNVRDKTYKEDTIRYIIDHDLFGGKLSESEKLGDKTKGSTGINSLTLVTEYRRGSKEFVTYCPALSAEFRRVPNYDPREGIPWNFFVLEPDPDFPLGLSQAEFLLADQQFQDLFQTSAYKNLLLAMEPPIKVAGWDTNAASYIFEPRKIWNLGTNPNQSLVEPVKIDNAVLTGFLTTREGISAGMLRQLNVMDGTVAADSGVPGFSATPQGVEAQQKTREISINQYQKRVENFFAEWANQALRMYINAMSGTHKLTVDETTRRKLHDIEHDELIEGNKIIIDFSHLSANLLEFKVRTGSLVEKKEDQEREALNQMALPFIQNLQGWSEENRPVIENEVLLPIAKRLLELSDTDIGQTLAGSLQEHIAKMVVEQMQGQLDGQQEQITQQQGQLDALHGALPPEIQQQLAQGALPPDAMGAGIPGPELPPEGIGGETSPSMPPMPDGIMMEEPPDLTVGLPSSLANLPPSPENILEHNNQGQLF